MEKQSEKIRDELLKSILENGLGSSITLAISKKLDPFMVEEQRMEVGEH